MNYQKVNITDYYHQNVNQLMNLNYINFKLKGGQKRSQYDDVFL